MTVSNTKLHFSFIEVKKIGITGTIRIAFIDVYTAMWTTREISLCGCETVRLALKRETHGKSMTVDRPVRDVL